MKIIKRPQSLLIATHSVFILLPLIAMNFWIFNRSFQLNKTHYILGGTAVVLILTAWGFLLFAKRFAFTLFFALSFSLIAANVYFLVRFKIYSIAFYAAFLFLFLGWYGLVLYRLFKEAYYNDKRRWFESLPFFIPHLKAEVQQNGKKISGKLSNFDQKGCFFFFESEDKKPLLEKAIQSLTLKYRDFQVDCPVECISKTIENGSRNGITNGLGLRFRFVNADKQKELIEFHERLRCSGYVGT